MADANLKAIISAEDQTGGAIDSAKKNIDSFQTKLKDLEPTFKKMAVAGTVAFGAISAIVIKGISDYAEASREMKIANLSLENSVKALSTDALALLQKQAGGAGKELGYLTGIMDQVGKSAIRLGIDNEEASGQFAKLFSITGDVSEAQKKLTMAENLSAFSGKTLTESVQALVNVHAGRATVLREFGINIKDVASEEEAYSLINEKTAGSAEKLIKPMAVLQIQMSEVSKAIGMAFKPALDGLLTSMGPIIEKVQAWIEQNPKLVQAIVMVTLVGTGLVAVIGMLGVATIAFEAVSWPLVIVVTAIALAVAGVVTVATLFHDKWTEIFTTLETKTGLISLLKQAWDDLVLAFNTNLMPALKKLWEALEPLKPFLDAMVKVIGFTLVVAIGAIILAIKGWAEIFTILVTAVTEVSAFLISTFGGALNFVIDKLSDAFLWADKLVQKIQQLNIIQGAKNLFNSVGNAVTGALGINDGIVQNGQVITTHPDDFIIATKTPGSLGSGGGKNINININGVTATRESAKIMGDMIVEQLRYQLKF